MAFDIIGEARSYCFDPRFAPIQSYFTDVCERTGRNIVLMHDYSGFVLVCGTVTTLASPEMARAFTWLKYWLKANDPDNPIIQETMPPEVVEACDRFDFNTLERSS